MTDQSRSITILTADDDPDDCVLVEEAFRESGLNYDLFFVQDGIKLLQYLRQQGSYIVPASAPRPDLILLDLNMPRKDGRESLAEIKANPGLRSIPVVVLTASNAEEDVLLTYDQGGAGFIIKPATFDGMVEVVKALNLYWFKIVELTSGESGKNSGSDISVMPSSGKSISQ
ncbi:MAG: response regulator [Anaerolineales bacterium]|jgi:CheY-like chemotaxis protein